MKFYIKPQLWILWLCPCRVVSYWNSTSNHNSTIHSCSPPQLYLIEILHQTTTFEEVIITSFLLYLIEILHQTTTLTVNVSRFSRLYLIEILHQTTTNLLTFHWRILLYLIEILHQTTTYQLLTFRLRSCILLKFYIKPQLTVSSAATSGSCILLKFYIKPQL